MATKVSTRERARACWMSAFFSGHCGGEGEAQGCVGCV